MKLSKCFFIIPLILAGCNDKIYDVSYYSEHLDEATKVVEQCKAGTVSNDNCKNAESALYKEKKKENVFRPRSPLKKSPHLRAFSIVPYRYHALAHCTVFFLL